MILLLEGLYEPEVQEGKTRCVIHPFIKHPVRKSVFTGYASDMNIMLSYYKCLDDWNDEHRITRKAFAEALKKKAAGVEGKYPEKCEMIVLYLERLSTLEKEEVHDIDALSGCFGHIMEEIFTWKHDVWEKDLRRMGFYLGKYIYILDAFEDLEEDMKNGSYNLLSFMSEDPDRGKKIEKLLTMMLAESCRAFERLPVVMHADIIRNILYSGVWTRYRAVLRKRNKENMKENV